MEIFRGRKPSFGVVPGLLSTATSVDANKKSAGQRQLSSIQGDFRGILFQIILSSRATLQNKRQSLLEPLLSTKLAITVQQNYAGGNPRRYFAKCERVNEQSSIDESERVPVEADPRGFMSKRLKAALVLNRQPLDSLSHSYTPTD